MNLTLFILIRHVCLPIRPLSHLCRTAYSFAEYQAARHDPPLHQLEMGSSFSSKSIGLPVLNDSVRPLAMRAALRASFASVGTAAVCQLRNRGERIGRS
jgi:hypothetical protein